AVLELIEHLSAYDGGRDVSPGALRNLQQAALTDSQLRDTIARASTPEPLYPPLDRQTLDAWSMTSLKDHPGRPDIAPWLRGWIEKRPQTTVVWRRWLPLLGARPPEASVAERFFEAAPIHSSEVLEAETFRVSEWLSKRAKKLLAQARRDNAVLGPGAVVAALFAGRNDGIRWWTLKDIAELSKKDLDRALSDGDLVVDARFGGLSHGLLDVSADDPPP